MSEQKRVRIVSNGLCGPGGHTRVFIDDEDVSNQITHVTWTIGIGNDSLSRATVTFARAEIEVDYVATTEVPVQLVKSDPSRTVVPGSFWADLEAPKEPEA